MLNEIRAALETLDGTVIYGDARQLTGKNIYNYTVFARRATDIKANKTGITEYYEFAVVRENYIPEGLVMRYVEALWAIGLQGPEGQVEPDYTVVGKTSTVIEVAVWRMYRPAKRVSA